MRAPGARRVEVDSEPAVDPLLVLGRTLSNAGSASIRARTAAHRESLKTTGVGIYYGTRAYGADKPEKMKDYLRSKLVQGHGLPELRETNCIEWGLEHVGAAYRAAGKGERWEEIFAAVLEQGSKATDLARFLQEDGWEGVYFNPDAENPLSGPKDDGSEHLATARTAAKAGTYYGLKVHHQVLNYRPTEDAEQPTGKDMAGLEALRQVPFFFGLARGGKHAFVGSHGEINEVHWDGQAVDPKLMNEVRLEKFPWLSGLLLVPPRMWPRGVA